MQIIFNNLQRFFIRIMAAATAPYQHLILPYLKNAGEPLKQERNEIMTNVMTSATSNILRVKN